MDQSIKRYRLQPAKRSFDRRIQYESELNPQQLEVVTTGDGPVLVIAGAGSGKTRAITYRVAWLLESGVRPSEILLLTFTNKAAREMLHRVALLTQLDTRQLWGGTFHHVGNMILRPYAKHIGLNSNYSILDQSDSKDVIAACVSELQGDKKNKQFPSSDVLQDIISFAMNTTNEIEAIVNLRYPHFQPLLPAILPIARRYAERKREMNAVDFDDLLLGCKYLLENNEEIRRYYSSRFQHILVDEYQDTNKLQADLIDQLAFTHRNVMVVGDDSQSIYSFRGANFANIMEFPDRYPDVQLFRLELNYRSTPEILHLANDIIRNNQHQFSKTLMPTRTASNWKPAVIPLRDAGQQADFVAQRILELQDEGTSLNQIAVLYRAHFHSMELQLELTRRGIPFVIHSGVRFFEQRHIKDVVAYLKVLLNPYDELSWRRILLLLPGIGTKTAERLWQWIRMQQDPVPHLKELADRVPRASKAAWLQFAQNMSELTHEGFLQLPSAAIEHVFKNGYEQYLEAKFPDYLNRREDIHQMSNFAMQFESLQQFLSELSLLGQIEAEEAPGEAPEDRIRLSTIHQAKGLEWEVVFVIYMVDGRFPSQRSMKDSDNLEEERRLFYVATTRSKNQLYLSYVLFSESFYQGPYFHRPSMFLKELSTDNYDLWQIDDSLSTDAGLPEFVQDDAGGYFH
ncbi:MAG TPA: ATP-dependent helicase [Acidobacteriota bacterium]|nr:ATP-dependent helicase [Acidobacteriota bacterium]